MSLRVGTRTIAIGIGLAVAALSAPGPVAAAPDPSGTPPAPVHGTDKLSKIPGRYIVVMKQRSTGSDRAAARRTAAGQGGKVSAEYGAALSGFAAELPAKAVEALRRNPNVDYIEADAEFQASATQSSAPWGLDRVDQRSLPLNGSYQYDGTGAGVTAYIVDSGIRKAHTQFGGRVLAGFTAVKDGRGTNDCNGHGTHVAGTVGGQRYGVAKGVTLRPVRVLNCRGGGSLSKILSGIDWVTAHHPTGAPAVANLSLGGEVSWAIDQAVRNSIFDGITYAVAAGNENWNACSFSPARVELALTVGSTTKTDSRSSFSNTGACVDVFAPGSGITSAWHTGSSATKTISGTSMASPHVAGAAALMLQQNPTSSPEVIAESLLQASTAGVVSNRGSGSPNLLLYAPGGQITQPPPTSDNLILNGSFEQGSVAWAATPDVITKDRNVPAYQGRWKALLNGYGVSHTDTLSQSVTLPAGGSASLSFYLWVDTEEGLSTAYDRLHVDIQSGGTWKRVETYSNVDAGGDFVRRSLDVSAYAGQPVVVRFTGTENRTRATAFLIDNVSLTAG